MENLIQVNSYVAMVKTCSTCKTVKRLEDFYKDKKGRYGVRSVCKPCEQKDNYLIDGNVLVVGDLHSPFIKEGYLDFCKAVQKKHKCKEVIFIGDIIDSHYSSFHTQDPDGYSAGDELSRAIDQLKDWYSAFPIASVIFGNHDLIISRKMMDAGLSSRWMQKMSDVLEIPNWIFMDHKVKNNILYVHGHGAGHAVVRAKRDLTSIVAGHFHSKAYVEYIVGLNFRIFGMQVGCGVDDTAYSMAYGKNSPKSAISCGVVLDNGRQAIVEMMEL